MTESCGAVMGMASIKKRPDGIWRARYRDEAGKEHARHFKRKVDAQDWLNEVTASVVTGRYVDPGAGKVTFSAWFSTWSDEQIWTEGTRSSAASAMKHVPFGDVPLGKLRTRHVQLWIKEMVDAGLSPATIRNRFNFTRMALRGAVRDRRIAENPSDSVTLPRARRAEAQMVLPTSEQVGRAVQEAPPMFRAYLGLCAFAGLRRGEASGIPVGDVDFLRRTVRVSRQVQGSNKATTTVVLPKHGSEREIFIPEALVEMLARHVQEIGTYGQERWIFQTGGALWHRGIAGHHWRQLRGRVGMEANTLHDFRHYYASGLIASGCDVVTVQRALGHASATITLGTYAHLWPSAEDKTRQAATGLMQEAGLAPADSLRTDALKIVAD